MSKLHQDVYLQARSNAFQLQSLPSQNHLGAAGAQRHHEAGAVLPLWAVWTHENTSTKSEPDKLDSKAPLATLWPPEGLGWNHELRGPFIFSWRKLVVETWTIKWRVMKWFVNVDRGDSKPVSDDPTQCSKRFFFFSCISESESARKLPERGSRQFVAMTTRGGSW